MKVECPNCQSTFNLSDSLVGADGADVRCGVCKHVFHVDAPQGDDFPGFGDSGASPIWPVQDESEAQPSGQEGGFAAELDSQRLKDPFDAVGVSSSEFTSIDFEKPAAPRSGKTVLLAVLLGLVLLIGVGTSALYLLEIWPFAKKPTQSAMENAPPLPPATDKATSAQPAPQALLASIVIEKYDHYFVDNDKAGKLFVIEGKMVNKSASTLGQIKIEATLRDAAEAPVQSKTITAGPKASNFELKTMGQADLDSRLNSVQEVLLNNGSVKSGEEVPFMFVFQDFPPNATNYSLKVTEYHETAASQAPAKQ